ncbi:MAG: CDP-glycerol glycerophosphotransferase family protein [Nocardioidaceae bacterium]
MDVSVKRLKRTRAAQLVKRTVLRSEGPNLPRLSVVVPFHDAVGQLQACVESLLAQTHPRVEIVLVDDGSVDGSAEVAGRLAAEHRSVRVVSQPHRGVGAARNAGAAQAKGTHLAFCDADDTVLPQGYERLAAALLESGSDIAIGSVTLQLQGQHQEPNWARRSNGHRRLGITLDERPEIMANLMPGTKVFRRDFWQQHRLSFSAEGFHADIVTMVGAMLAARRVDIIPSVVYRWHWREDGASLLQQGLLDRRRAADRVSQICRAGELVTSAASEPVQKAFFSEVLHTTVPDLVRAAVTRDDEFWETVGAELNRLLELVSDETYPAVPVEDRIVAWLCAHDERDAAENFLEYAFDNQNGYPHRMAGDRPHITLPFIDALAEASDRLTAVADVELRYRTRLTEVRWTSPTVLHLEGAAFVEYLGDDYADSEITLVLREAGSGRTVRLPTRPTPEPTVNLWSARANEDHSGAAFTCEVDVAALPEQLGAPQTAAGAPVLLEVLVELRIGAHERLHGFHSRGVSGSAGLLEPSVVGRSAAEPLWTPHDGLTIELRTATRDDQRPVRPAGPVSVSDYSVEGGVLRLVGTTDRSVEIALIGPRARSAWVSATRTRNGFEVGLDVFTDEWGVGRTSLPADRYAVTARTPDGTTFDVLPERSLWRTLPRVEEESGLHFLPHVTVEGTLLMRIVPAEWRSSRPPYLRRRLRDEVYPQARTEPLVDVVLFETFAGKAAGDNPGALCKELLGRDEALELVVSVMDYSVEVPAGARPVIRFSREYFELLGRARYLLVNASLPYFFRKREGQLYFQTWHGSPLKRIAHDRPHLDFFNWHHRRQLLIARDGWDYLLSQSEFCTRSLSSAFRYDGPVMELGYPRNDLMLTDDAGDVRRRTRAALGIAEHQRVVLYAPTWRDNLRVGRVFDKVLYLDPHEVVERLDDAVVLVRGHYNSVRAAEDVDPDNRVIDVTRYPDIADLYVAADALVTDYSSVFFDFVLTDKPMVFLAPDLIEYRDDNRGFYLDYHETVPGPVVLTTAEVVDTLRGADAYAERRRAFRAEFAPHDDGKAAARVIDAVLSAHPYR